ncbi:phylloplanin [Elaeis guineensis]|uniref:Phylloplanin n=1 Tax=Elaeis guineensis var. tenera TaxID=51953 RepID=A0A6I9R8Q6_ELAGV|nr:phylloplanin [Elaeis guineensis]
MALRTFLFAVVLLAGLCAPVAQAQLGRILISGIVPCSNSTKTSTATTPVFPNALVQLQCGGSVVSSATTDDNGVFTMVLNLVTTLLSTLLSGCKLVVGTPLSTCDASLPSDGFLQSALQFITGGLLSGVLGGIFNIIPAGFNLVH